MCRRRLWGHVICVLHTGHVTSAKKKGSHLVHCAESSGAEHFDLLELCLFEDTQQSLVRSFSAGSERLH